MTSLILHDPTTAPSAKQIASTGRVSGARSAENWVEEVLCEAVLGHHEKPTGVRLLRLAPKRLAEVTLADGSTVVLKQYRDDRGAWTRRFLDRFVAAGFGAPSRFASSESAPSESAPSESAPSRSAEVRRGVTPALGWSAAQRTLVAQRAPGQSWRSCLAGLPFASIDVADWLLALQNSVVALPDRRDYRAEDALRHQGRELSQYSPEHAARLRRVVSAVCAQLYADDRLATGDLVTSHGDLHPGNLFVAGSAPLTVTAIDLDTAGLRRASYDVGYLVAQLLVVSWMRTGSFGAGGQAAATLWQRWLAASGQDAEAVPAQVARALIQSLHFESVTYRSGTPQLADTWLELAGTVLAGGVDSLLSSLPSTTKADS